MASKRVSYIPTLDESDTNLEHISCDPKEEGSCIMLVEPCRFTSVTNSMVAILSV